MGYKTGVGWGEASEVLPLQKGGTQTVLAILKRGTDSFEVVLTWELEVLAILIGGANSSRALKGGWGARTVLPCLEGGGATSSRPTILRDERWHSLTFHWHISRKK